MTYHIETTNEAKANRAKCFDYIAERSPAGALRWLEAYEQAHTCQPGHNSTRHAAPHRSIVTGLG